MYVETPKEWQGEINLRWEISTLISLVINIDETVGWKIWQL